jgi:hypothetical protein
MSEDLEAVGQQSMSQFCNGNQESSYWLASDSAAPGAALGPTCGWLDGLPGTVAGLFKHRM